MNGFHCTKSVGFCHETTPITQVKGVGGSRPSTLIHRGDHGQEYVCALVASLSIRTRISRAPARSSKDNPAQPG